MDAVCENCGQHGHIAINCPSIQCSTCGQLGHESSNCPGVLSSNLAQPGHVTDYHEQQPRPPIRPKKRRDVWLTQPQRFHATGQGASPTQPKEQLQTRQSASPTQPQGSIETGQGASRTKPQGSLQRRQRVSPKQLLGALQTRQSASSTQPQGLIETGQGASRTKPKGSLQTRQGASPTQPQGPLQRRQSASPRQPQGSLQTGQSGSPTPPQGLLQTRHGASPTHSQGPLPTGQSASPTQLQGSLQTGLSASSTQPKGPLPTGQNATPTQPQRSLETRHGASLTQPQGALQTGQSVSPTQPQGLLQTRHGASPTQPYGSLQTGQSASPTQPYLQREQGGPSNQRQESLQTEHDVSATQLQGSLQTEQNASLKQPQGLLQTVEGAHIRTLEQLLFCTQQNLSRQLTEFKARTTQSKISMSVQTVRQSASPFQRSSLVRFHKGLTQRRLVARTRRLNMPLTLATEFWRECARDWYPKLHSETYFIPPLLFNRVQYDIQSVEGQTVLVPTHDHITENPIPINSPAQSIPLASRVWPDNPVPSGDPIPRVQDSDVAENRAMEQVLHNIQVLAEKRREVMIVLSRLEFRKYLDNQIDPVTLAATLLLPTPSSLGYSYGDFDVLIISRQYGLIVGEVKSVGADPQHTTEQAIVTRVKRAVQQLKKAKVVLGKLVSDLAPVNVTKTLMLPNVTSTQLQQALDTDPKVKQDLCECVGAPDITAAVARCLCADSELDKSSVWWERAVTDHGHDRNMTDDIYETLVARFCGPATTVEVPTVTTPRRVLEIRTMSEAIAHTGLRMAVLTLYPEQVELLNRPGLPRVFLWGPPGTGKTVVLTMKGLQWGHQGKDVHLLGAQETSRAAIMLMEHQLMHVPGTCFTSARARSAFRRISSAFSEASAVIPAAAPRLHRHMYDFENNKGDVKTAVSKLQAAANNGELYVIADEAFCGSDSPGTGGGFAEFVTRLASSVTNLHIWAAAVTHDVIPSCMRKELLTKPVRSPPAVIREVQKTAYIDATIVPFYSSSATPAPTDGPAVRTLHHYNKNQPRSDSTPLPGHTGGRPEDCGLCGENIVELMEDLRVGQIGQSLQYLDTIILCDVPHDSLRIVKRLRAHGLPVQVVTSSDGEDAIREVALAARDVVTVTDWRVMMGLERRVVVVVGLDVGFFPNPTRLYAMSRSTSLLVLFD